MSEKGEFKNGYLSIPHFPFLDVLCMEDGLYKKGLPLGIISRPEGNLQVFALQLQREDGFALATPQIPPHVRAISRDVEFEVIHPQGTVMAYINGALVEKADERIFYLNDIKNLTKPSANSLIFRKVHVGGLVEELITHLLVHDILTSCIFSPIETISDDAKDMRQRLYDSQEKKGIRILQGEGHYTVMKRETEQFV